MGTGPGAIVAAPRPSLEDGTALITGSGDGVHLRAEPTFGAEVVGTLADGTQVNLRIAVLDTVLDPDGATRWWPVAFSGDEGWVAGYFLDVGRGSDAESNPVPTRSAPVDSASPADLDTTGDGDSSFDPTSGLATVTSSDGANLRVDPWTGAEIVAVLSSGTSLELRLDQADSVYAEGEQWWPVWANGQPGWIAGSNLSDNQDGSTASAAPAPAPVITYDPVRFSGGDYVTAIDADAVNIRVEPAVSAGRVGLIPGGDVVQIMDGPVYDDVGTGWYLVTDGAVTGYSDGNLFQGADQPSPPAAEPEPAAAAAATRSVAPAGPTGSFINPVPGAIFTQAYGCSPYAFEPYEASFGCNFHNGIDLAQNAYSAVLAADGGVVVAAGWCDCGLGFYVEVDHLNGFSTVYGHMAEQPYVVVGQAVNQGDVVGPVGSTGLSTGPHVHFMLKANGSTIDPLGYVAI